MKGVAAVIYGKELSHFAADKFFEFDIPAFSTDKIPLLFCKQNVLLKTTIRKKVDEKKHGCNDVENYISGQKRYNNMKPTTMRFSGQLLNRGFWLYCWKVSDGKCEVLYVGRTGDSSSINAASPFSRVSRHLDTRESAKGNSLYRQLKRKGMEPSMCSYLMSAYGPVFEETKDRAAYKGFRDRMAALEKELAHALKGAGYTVIGNHQSKKRLEKTDEATLKEALATIKKDLSLV